MVRKEAKLVLQNLIKDEEFDKKLFKDDHLYNRKLLFEFVYPQSESILFLRKLESVKQISHFYFKDYLKEVDKWILAYAISAGLSDREVLRKREESILRGLTDATRIELTKQNFTKADEVIQYLKRTEQGIIAILKDKETIETKLSKLEITPRKYDNDKDIRISKYCKIHKTFGHSLRECYLNKFNKSNKSANKSFNHKKEEGNLLLKEKELVLESIEIPVKINNEEITGTIDTGSTSNFISEETAKRFNVKKEKLEKEVVSKIANNSEIKISEKCNINFKIKQNKNEIKEDFYIFNNLPVELLLGNKFLTNNECKIDYKNFGIFIGNSFVPFSNQKLFDYRNDPENALLEATFIKRELNVEEEIEQYKRINDRFTYINVDPIKLQIKKDYKIIQSKQFPISYKYKENIQKELNRLIKEDIIIKSENGLWSSPGFCIPKRNGEPRLVIDYRLVNDNIIDEVITLPKIFENLQVLGENKMYSSINLKNGFNQLRLHKDSRDITGFVVLNKHYCYKRLPFGLKCGPKIFQKQIEKILEDCKGVFIYVDDIIIYGKTMAEHNENLIRVLEKLKKYHVRINFEKSEFFKNEITILGHIIKENKIEIDKNKINNLIKIPEKMTRKMAQKIIGSLNWYRMFIPNFSDKIKPLTDLLQ